MNNSPKCEIMWINGDYSIVAKPNEAVGKNSDLRKEIHEVLCQMFHRAKKRGRPTKVQSEELKSAA